MFQRKKAQKIPVYWQPQVGPQTAAALCPADEIFFGGTRGGGKSDCAIGRQVYGAAKYGRHWNGLMIRRKYKDLAELRRRFNQLIAMGMPAEQSGGENQTGYIRYKNGAKITLAAIKELSQADDWIGHQFTEITVDEAPNIPFISLLLDKLKGSLRSPAGVPCHVFLTGNPGGPGASIIKQMYIDPDPNGTGAIQYDEEAQSTRVFIRSTLDDNQILCQNDPKYVRRLRSIRDENLKKAWLDGRWDTYIGQAFDFDPLYHSIKPIWPIPDYAPLYMTFDWGFGAPFAVGWWWVDADNRLYRFAEWYGCKKNEPGVGCRMTDQQIAQGILERERKLGIADRSIIRLAGKDCFNKKPDYMGGGQGPSTYDEFLNYSKHVQPNEEKWTLDIVPGDVNRLLKIRQFRNRLMIPLDDQKVPTGEMPMMVVYDTCREFIRTVPAMCLDDLTGEDLEDGQEDHIYDEACHICMARPLSSDIDGFQKQIQRTQARKQVQAMDSDARIAAQEYAQILYNLAEDQEVEYDDPFLDLETFEDRVNPFMN
jgi:hypothetical protein